jgi:hypothetical protein
MKQSFFSLVLIVIATIAVAQDNSSAQWAKNNITVDGNAADWNAPLKHYDNDTRLFFDFKNDSNNLYLCFQTKDEMTEAKIMRAGMKIMISDKINGKHKSTINFPLGFKRQTRPTQTEDGIKPDPLSSHSVRHLNFLSQDTIMEVKGFADKNGLISANDVTGIHAAINWDSTNILTYEVAIPLNKLFGAGYNIKDFSKDISLNVVINAMAAGSQNQSAGAFSGRGGHGGGRMGGGRMGGSGAIGHEGNRAEGEENGSYGSERAAMSQKSELKQKFALAMPQQ